MKRVISLFVAGLLLITTLAIAGSNVPPLPSDVKIDYSTESPWTGIWLGTWESKAGNGDITLVVESLSGNIAIIVWSWYDVRSVTSPQLKYETSGFARMTATIKDRTMKTSWGRNKYVFKLHENGLFLDLERYNKGRKFNVAFTKCIQGLAPFYPKLTE